MPFFSFLREEDVVVVAPPRIAVLVDVSPFVGTVTLALLVSLLSQNPLGDDDDDHDVFVTLPFISPLVNGMVISVEFLFETWLLLLLLS